MISASNEQLQQQLECTLLSPDCHSWWISKMQPGREDTLEERYAIKFCFKLGKNATEMDGMLQTAFWPSCMNQASVFEWHKRFKEGKESVRDDERCGRSKEVRAPKLIGQIKNFMDKDRRVSIETISTQFDVCVGTVHTVIHEELRMRKICAKFVLRELREDQKERHCHDSREMFELINSDLAVLDALVTCNESWIYCYDPETKRQSSQWKHAGSSRPKKARQSKSSHKPLMIPFFDSTGMIYMHWVSTGQTVNKEYYVEVLREFRKRFLGKRPTLFKSGQWHFHQDNAPVHNFIVVIDYLTKMGIKTVAHPPYSPDLAPCDFCLFPKHKEKLSLSLWDSWGDERGCDEGHWHADTRGLPWGLPEVVETVQLVHCCRRRLLWRVLEFHMCTLNKSAHMKKSLVGIRICWLNLNQTDKTSPRTGVSWVWHKTVSDGEVLYLEIWKVWSTPFFAITPRSTSTWC